MKIYTTVYGHKMTAEKLIAEARAELDRLTDHGDQLHRRAVAGKPISAHVEGPRGGYHPGYVVGIRVANQYTNRADCRLRTEGEANALAAEINEYLQKNGNIGIEK